MFIFKLWLSKNLNTSFKQNKLQMDYWEQIQMQMVICITQCNINSHNIAKLNDRKFYMIEIWEKERNNIE